MSEIQAIIIDKSLGYRYARAWIYEHGFVPIKPAHETKHYYRFRLREPTYSDYRLKKLAPGIMAVIGFY